MIIFICQIGFKKTLSMLSIWPGMLLIAVFTPFTLSCITLNKKKYLFISKKWTVINFVLSIVFFLCGSCFLNLYYLSTFDFSWDRINYTEVFGIPSVINNLKICLPLFLFSIV